MVVVALVLMAGPILAAEGEGGERPKRPEGERGPPRVKVSEEDQAKMKDQIAALEKAVAELTAKATEVLGDERAARSFVAQTIFAKMRPTGTREGTDRPAPREGSGERGPRRPAPEATE